MSQLPQLLRYLDRDDITEIVVQTGKAPAVRMGGEYRPLGKTPVTTPQVEALVAGTPLAALMPQGDTGGASTPVTLYDKDYTVRIARRGPAVQLRVELASRGSDLPSSPMLEALRTSAGPTEGSVARQMPVAPRTTEGSVARQMPVAPRTTEGSVARQMPVAPRTTEGSVAGRMPMPSRSTEGSVAGRMPAPPSSKPVESPSPSPRPQPIDRTHDAHRAVTRPVIPEDERPSAHMIAAAQVPPAAQPPATERQRPTIAKAIDARELMDQARPQPSPRPGPAQASTPIAPPVAPARSPAPPAAARAPMASTPTVRRADGAASAFEALVIEARSRNASDLHIVADRPPLIRTTGELLPAGAPIAAAEVERMLLPLLSAEQREALDARGYADFGLDAGPSCGRLRCNVSRQRSGLKGSFRLVMSPTPTLDALGLPKELARVTTYHQGLVVIAGPNGHGKTTTLAAIVDLINASRPHHILTVEEPVEFLHGRKKALVSQREVGPHTRSFATALKASLREDPDVIVIGELRDRETVEIALTAAETGHLVMATMSTPSAAKTIDRLIDLFPPDDQAQVRATLAGALKFIVAQRLLPSATGDEFVAAIELLTGVPALWALIRDNKLFQLPNLQQRGRAFGMIRFDDSLLELLRAGKITEETAMRYAESKKEFQNALRPQQPAAPPAAASGPQPSGGGLADIKSRMGGLFGGSKKE